ncbi:uncharacterized protein LOC144167098 [Haemaphysalis longicornis]
MKLPRYLEDLLRNISNYFSQRSKRQAQLSALQEFLHTEKNKILRPCETRWLVLYACVERVLEEWETLRLLFLQASEEDRIVAAESILNHMNCATEAYFRFMKFVLNFFNRLNALFQSNGNLIGELQAESQRLLQCLLQNFVQPSALERDDVNPMDPRVLLPLEEVYLDEGCNSALKKCAEVGMDAEVRDLRIRCLSFYQTATVEVKKRLPVSRPFFHEVQFVTPKTALSAEARRKLLALPTLQNRYAHLLPDASRVKEEWKMLPSYFSEDEKFTLEDKPAALFWADLHQMRTFGNKQEFLNIATLAQLILSLPHSNAATERSSSQLSGYKSYCELQNGASDDEPKKKSIVVTLVKRNLPATRHDIDDGKASADHVLLKIIPERKNKVGSVFILHVYSSPRKNHRFAKLFRQTLEIAKGNTLQLFETSMPTSS